jgi:hypothetical protein
MAAVLGGFPSMARWIFKAIAQKAATFVPGGYLWYDSLRRHLTGAQELDASTFEQSFRASRWHLEKFFEGRDVVGFRVLELGTGRFPILPIACYLCGASRVWTIDKQAWLRRANVRKALELFIAYADNGRLEQELPRLDTRRMAALVKARDCAKTRPAEVLDQLQIEPMVGDARRTSIKEHSIDWFCSNSVLQEIPEDILLGILIEFRRLAAPRAILSHYINIVDAYASFDDSITRLNYLKYSDFTWKFLTNSLHYQNRLRTSDYRRIHETAGFSVSDARHERADPGELRGIRLARRFRTYSTDDLLVIKSWLVAVTPQPSSDFHEVQRV